MCHSEESEQVSWIRELPTLLTPPNTVRLAVTPIYVFGCDPLSRWPGITRGGSNSCNYSRRAQSQCRPLTVFYRGVPFLPILVSDLKGFSPIPL